MVKNLELNKNHHDLLIKNCNKGGIYEFFNDIRYKDGKEDYSFVEKILDNKDLN